MAAAVVGYYSLIPGGIYDELGTAGAAEEDIMAKSVCSGYGGRCIVERSRASWADV